MVDRTTFVKVDNGDKLSEGYFNGIFDATNKGLKDVYSSITKSMSIVGHTGTTLSVAIGNTSISQTTDYQSGNITFTSRNTNVKNATGVHMVNCKADRAYSIAMEVDTGDGGYTSNSGAAWSDTSTDPPNVTAIYDMSFPTTTLAVAFGNNSGAGASIWLSTDGGDNWAEASAAAGDYSCGDMYDGTVGFAVVQGSKNVFITSDSADNWADTTRDTGSGSNADAGRDSIFALSATEWIYVDAGGDIYKGSTSANGTLKAAYGGDGGQPSRIIKTANGNLYVALYTAKGTTQFGQVILLESIDNGDTWKSVEISMGSVDKDVGNTHSSAISEVADNVLAILNVHGSDAVRGRIIELDVT